MVVEIGPPCFPFRTMQPRGKPVKAGDTRVDVGKTLEMTRSTDRLTPGMLRRIAWLSILLLFVSVSLAAGDQQSTVTLTISGMYCESCASGIVAMLKRTEGVVKADVSYEERRARVDYDATKTSPAK